MKTPFSFMLLCVFSSLLVRAPSWATIINFDIGPLGGLAPGGGLTQTAHGAVDYDVNGLPDVWNHFGQIAGAVDHGGVVDITGVALPGFTLRADGVGNRDGNTTLNAGWGDAQQVPQAVINSWYFRTSTAVPITLTLKGLVPGSLWDVEVWNAFNWSNISDIRVNGLFADGNSVAATPAFGDDWNRLTNGWTPRTGLLFPAFEANASGHLVVTIFGSNPTVQALRFTSVVPEPSSAVLMVVGTTLLCRVRRRCHA